MLNTFTFLLTFLLSCQMALAGNIDPKLVGKWIAPKTADTASGFIFFKADGVLELKPEGFDKAVGSYTTSDNWVDMDLSAKNMGKASAFYTISDNGSSLTLKYFNGLSQSFKKEVEQPKNLNLEKSKGLETSKTKKTTPSGAK